MKIKLYHLALLPFLAAPAQAESWKSDAMGSYALLSYDHSHLIEVEVQLPAVTAQAQIQGNDFTNAQLIFNIKMGSMVSYQPRWPKALASEHFFDLTKFPTMDFKSTSIKKTEQGLVVDGVITAHGVTKPIEFQATPSVILPFEGKKYRGLTLTGLLPWPAFGMSYKDRPALENFPEFGAEFKLKVILELSTQSSSFTPPPIATPRR